MKTEKSRTNSYKRKRKATVFEKLKSYFAKLQEDRAEGTQYEAGTAMEPLSKQETVVKCGQCHGVGHKTVNSKQCYYCEDKVKTGAEAEQAASQVDTISTLHDTEDTYHCIEVEDDHSNPGEADDLEEISLVDQIELTLDADTTLLSVEVKECD